MNQLRLAAVAPSRWKNGGGQTRELLRRPGTGAGDWRWRISVAEIESDGPFSAFPGQTRHFAVLSGAGVRLRWPDGRAATLGPADAALCFDGADPPDCKLLAGPTQDLNVMVDARLAHARLAPARLGQPWQARAAMRALFTCRPLRLLAGPGQTWDLPAATLAWIDSGSDHAWSLAQQEAVPVTAPATATAAAIAPAVLPPGSLGSPGNPGSPGAPAAWWITLHDHPAATGPQP